MTLITTFPSFSRFSRFVDYYNSERYHESPNNLKPVDVYEGRERQVLDQRERIKRKTLQMRLKLKLEKPKYVS